MNMLLGSPWFEAVRDGRKVYIGSATGRHYKVGDKSLVTYRVGVGEGAIDRNKTFIVEVVELLDFKTLRQAFESIPLEEIFGNKGMTVDKAIEMYQQYPQFSTQLPDGVFFFKVKKLADVATMAPDDGASERNPIKPPD